MRTPDEIKKGLEEDLACCCECDNCHPNQDNPYGCEERRKQIEIADDAFAYIRQLETAVEKYRGLFEDAYDKLQKAYVELDGVENCTNCMYGDGAHDYCYDCRWFDKKNNRLKWVEKKES